MTRRSSPAETIKAAIDKLNSESPPTSIMIAQRALLTEAHGYATDWEHGRNTTRGHSPETIYGKELALATAILGGA